MLLIGPRLMLVALFLPFLLLKGASWVNNSANIDDSKIVWAHDMGPQKNEDPIRYFSDRQVWWLDPGQNEVQFMRYSLANNSANPRVSNTSQRGQAGLSGSMGVR